MAVLKTAFRPIASLALRALAFLIEIMLRVIGVRSTYRLLLYLSPDPSSVRSPFPERQMVNLICSIFGSRTDKCLRRALLIWWALRWRRVDTDVHFSHDGVRGHAWVVWNDIIIADSQDLSAARSMGSFRRLF